MPPVFDMQKCCKCGLCERICPVDAIFLRDEGDKQPYVKYPSECWHCGSCRQDCPEEAITIVFPPDMLFV